MTASVMVRLPLPPPWIANADGSGYTNTVTREVLKEHPYANVFQSGYFDQALMSGELVKIIDGTVSGTGIGASDNTVKVKDVETVMGEGETDDDGIENPGVPSSSVLSIVNRENNQCAAGETVESLTLVGKTGTVNGSHPSHKKKDKVSFTDFRCEWREAGLMGDTNSYGLRIRYFEDQRTMVKLDGVDGEWLLTTLDGPYGPVNKFDLFVGAKVRIFGRHLTITSASASVCHDITVRAKKMEKMIKVMQTRVESVGAVPIIRRAVPTAVRHIVRSAKAEGHENLRKLLIDCTKLAEQLCDLGLSHSIKDFEAEVH